MGRAGPELPPLALSKTPILGNVRTESGTPDAREGAQTEPTDPDLRRLIDAWPAMPERQRRAVLKAAGLNG
jgi:hypothetical protein